MTPERLDEIRGMAETLQWGRDSDAAEAMLDLLAERDSLRLALDASEEALTAARADVLARGEAYEIAARGGTAWVRQTFEHLERIDAEKLRADTAEAALAESRAREVVVVEVARRASDEYDNEVDQAPFLAAKRDLDDVLTNSEPAARDWMERTKAAAREEGRALGIEEAAKACDAEADAERRFGKQKAAISAFTVAAARIRALSTSPAASVPHPLLMKVAEAVREECAMAVHLYEPGSLADWDAVRVVDVAAIVNRAVSSEVHGDAAG